MSIDVDDMVPLERSVLDPPAPPRERSFPGAWPSLPRADRAPRTGRLAWRPQAVRGWLELLLPCLLAAGLCLYELGTRSLWLDEGATVSIVSQHGAALWRGIAHDGGNMLVYYVFMHGLVSVFGDGAALIRMPSVVCTVLTVLLTGLIGRRLFDRRVAFAAALLCAVSLPLVFWGQDARGYAPLVTFCAGSFLAFVAIIQRDGPPPWWLLAGYVLSTVLAVYMGFVGVLVVPAQLLLLVGQRRELRRPLAIAVGAIALACIPLLLLASERGTSQLFWVTGPSAKGIGQTARWLTSAGLPPNFHRTATGTPTLVLSVLLLAVALGLTLKNTLADWRVRHLGAETWGTLLVLSWLVVPIVLSVVESLAGQPILLFRNSVICLPAVALALAWVLMHAPVIGTGSFTIGSVPLRPLLAWAGVGALVTLRALQLAPSYGVSPENWKTAEHYVSARVKAGDCIAFYPLDGRMPFDYYVRGGENAAGTVATVADRVKVPSPVDPTTPWAKTPPYVEDYQTPTGAQLQQIESSCPRLWLVMSHNGQQNGTAGSRLNWVKGQVMSASLELAYAKHRSKSFGWASAVHVELLSQPARRKHKR